MDRSVLTQMPDTRPYDLSGDLISNLATNSNSPVFGYRLTDGYRFDTGTLSEYVLRQFDALDGTIQVNNIKLTKQHFGENVEIGIQTKLAGHNIFGNQVKVGDHCEIEDSVVLDGSTIGNGVKLTGVVVGQNCRILDNVVLGRGTALGDWNVVG